MRLKKLFDFNKIKDAFLSFLTGRPFWCLLILSLLLFIYAAFLFYFYALRIPPPAPLETKTEIKLETYKNVIERLKQREDNIRQGIAKEYPDVFR